jgi:hypothetical protein
LAIALGVSGVALAYAFPEPDKIELLTGAASSQALQVEEATGLSDGEGVASADDGAIDAELASTEEASVPVEGEIVTEPKSVSEADGAIGADNPSVSDSIEAEPGSAEEESSVEAELQTASEGFAEIELSADEAGAIDEASETEAQIKAGTIQSPYQLAFTLEEVSEIIKRDDGIIPVTNIEVPEIKNGKANGIIITDQDLNVAIQNLNEALVLPGGTVITNMRNMSYDYPGHIMPMEYYAEYGIYYSDSDETWMYDGKPIGILFDIERQSYVNLPIDRDGFIMLDEVNTDDYAFISVSFKKVGIIDGLREMKPDRAVFWTMYFLECGQNVIGPSSHAIMEPFAERVARHEFPYIDIMDSMMTENGN